MYMAEFVKQCHFHMEQARRNGTELPKLTKEFMYKEISNKVNACKLKISSTGIQMYFYEGY